MNKQLFFCFGLPKSGTTFLQRTLNLHPEVSCPSEHNFKYLLDAFRSIFRQYEGVQKSIDIRTGGQGIIPVDNNVVIKTFRCAIENIIYESARGKKVAGANDNAIIGMLDSYNQLFESPRFIAIFRNPVDQAISAWHHNTKLAAEENNNIHLDIMNKHGGFDGWVKFCAQRFVQSVRTCKTFADRNENLMMIRYEDLKQDKKYNMEKLFRFLEVSTDESLLDDIIKNSSLEAMKDASVRKQFFRSGSTDMGREEISAALRADVARIAAPALETMGYNIGA
jgi:hypothetical protein